MKNTFVVIFALLSIVCFATSGSAQGKMVTIPESAYNTILQRLDALQAKVDNLEKAKPKPNLQRMDALQTKVDNLEKAKAKSEKVAKQLGENVDDIYDTLDEVETKTIKDRINWGAELRTRVDNFKVTDELNPQTGQLEDENTHNHWTSRFRLNLGADIMEGLTFNSRITVYKNWSNTEKAAYYPYADPNSAHVPNDTSLKLDRAYIDWIIPNLPLPVALTIGRQPSSEGPGAEFKENRLRQSTYPVLLFDGEADGVVATVGLERILKLKNSALRFAYGKGYQSSDDKTAYLDSRYGIDDLNVYGAFFETELPKLKDSLLVLSYVRGNDFVDNPVNPGKNLGDMDLFGVHIQTPHLLDSNFDLFFSWGLNKSHPNGDYVNMPLGNGMTMPMGLLSSDGEDDQTGWALFTGLRYTIPFESLNHPKIGFEYNHGSRYWFSFTQGSTELYNKLSTRGDVFDFYYIQPFNKYLFLRAGYTRLNYDYSGSGWHIGEPMSIDQDLENFYLLFDCRF